MDDAVDLAIVSAVSRDGRATLADLSAATGLSVSAAQARLKRLEARGVITGYRATIDASAWPRKEHVADGDAGRGRGRMSMLR